MKFSVDHEVARKVFCLGEKLWEVYVFEYIVINLCQTKLFSSSKQGSCAVYRNQWTMDYHTFQPVNCTKSNDAALFMCVFVEFSVYAS